MSNSYAFNFAISVQGKVNRSSLCIESYLMLLNIYFCELVSPLNNPWLNCITACFEVILRVYGTFNPAFWTISVNVSLSSILFVNFPSDKLRQLAGNYFSTLES